MRLYVVYDSNEDGHGTWIDSYWLNYKNALRRLNELWIYCDPPPRWAIESRIKTIETGD